MKISARQKELNRIALIRAAVDVISVSGYDEATLRQISSKAGLSDPVIYNYFPTKQSLLYSYVEWSIEQAFVRLAKIPKLHELCFSEQIQLLMQTHFEVMEKDLPFVKQLFPLVFVTGLSTTQEALAPSRRLFTAYVEECFRAATQAGEFQTPPFFETVIALFWDFHSGMIGYWLKDTSELHANTNEVIQRTMAVITEILRSQMLSRIMDLTYFLIRTHLLTPHPESNPGPTSKPMSSILDPYRKGNTDG